jgi:hypothetical protein
MNTPTRLINVAEQYSAEPAGRYPEDGNFNGQRFREELLLPILAQRYHVVVDFDGTEGYGSSFLDEAFGGLVRQGHFSEAALRELLEVRSGEDPTVVDEVWSYIDDAEKSLRKAK